MRRYIYIYIYIYISVQLIEVMFSSRAQPILKTNHHHHYNLGMITIPHPQTANHTMLMLSKSPNTRHAWHQIAASRSTRLVKTYRAGVYWLALILGIGNNPLPFRQHIWSCIQYKHTYLLTMVFRLCLIITITFWRVGSGFPLIICFSHYITILRTTPWLWVQYFVCRVTTAIRWVLTVSVVFYWVSVSVIRTLFIATGTSFISR